MTIAETLRPPWAALLFLVVFLAGCTTTTVTPEFVQPPAMKYQVVAVGDISIVDKQLWGQLAPHFRRAFIERIRKEKTFTGALDLAPNPLPTEGLLFTGKITEVDKGSKAARLIIGFGAGRAKVRGQFQIRDASGKVLVKFESKKAYSGGVGIGGADFLDMQDLMAKFGEDVAGSLISWSKGQGLEPPAPE